MEARLLLWLILANLACSAANAADPARCFSRAKIVETQVARIEPNGVLIVSGGGAVTLEGVLLPDGRDPAAELLRRDAVAALRSLSRGRIRLLTSNIARRDRYGRIRAQIQLAGKTTESWLQEAILKRGLARVATAPDRPECAEELYAAEDQARAVRRGLWADARYAIRSPRTVDLPELLGTFQVVEGKVVNASVRGGRAYLNFGHTWRTDFTVTISSHDLKRFRMAGIDPETYAGKTVRVRGWIERMNGPEIEIADPAQIQILAGK